MADTPANEVIGFAKIDLSDGFWRMIVEENQKWNFCYVMPDPPGSRIRIVVPSALQMGWAESPPYFCAATQAGCDVAQHLINGDFDLPPHPLEGYVLPTEPSELTPSQQEEIHRFVAVYVDDYILAAVENKERTLREGKTQSPAKSWTKATPSWQGSRRSSGSPSRDSPEQSPSRQRKQMQSARRFPRS
jgi:hypothetical protein